VKVHSNSGNTLLDFFAGSGTLGEAAAKNGRSFILVDNNPEAIEVMHKRLSPWLEIGEG
jgi:site-specific DNA-methyltransferase (adenine-specific)